MKEPKWLQVAGDLRRRIRRGELPPGTKLPSHNELCGQYGVSDIVVRRALRELATQGLIRGVPRRGVFVAHRQDGDILPSGLPLSAIRQAAELEEYCGGAALGFVRSGADMRAILERLDRAESELQEARTRIARLEQELANAHDELDELF